MPKERKHPTDPNLKKPKFEPNVELDMSGFLTELRAWIDAIEGNDWETASERLRDACEEAYCLEGWNEFTSRLGTTSMTHHVQNMRQFLVAVETTARAHRDKRDKDE